MPIPIFEERLWAGTRESLAVAANAQELHAERLKAGWNDQEDDQEDDDDEEDEHDLLQVVGNIGVINIKGAMVNSDAWYLKYYGMVGYPQIKGALVAAARNADVKHILLNIDSGGGSVSGCQDTGALIRKIHTDLKPVAAYTGAAMCSAAYWLGSSAGSVFAADTAVVGSIGVIATHKEYSKMYADMGVGVTVVRSGPYKALANPNEALSEEGQTQLQNLVDATDAVFVNHVAAMRNRTPDYVTSTMGQGREFIGAQAADVGLVDGITSMDALISQLQRRYIDTSLQRNDTQTNQGFRFRADTNTELEMAGKDQNLTDEQIAALKAEQSGNGEKPEANAPVEQKHEPQATAAFAETLTLLTGSIADLRIENTGLKSELDKLKAVVGPLADLATKSLSQMRVALGGAAVEAGSMSHEDLLAAHATASVEFEAKFPVGGVASVKPEVKPNAADHKMSAFEAAMLRAGAGRSKA